MFSFEKCLFWSIVFGRRVQLIKPRASPMLGKCSATELYPALTAHFVLLVLFCFVFGTTSCYVV
jgi:hypothetical protein